MKRPALILHRDDAPDRFLADRLGQLGYAATSFAESDFAIAWARQHQPDLVALNQLDRPVAASVCEALKLDPGTNLIPILVIAADKSDSENLECQISPNAWLSEPHRHRALTQPGSPINDQLRQAIKQALAWKSDLERQGISSEVCFHLPSTISSLERLTQHLESLFLSGGLAEDQTKRFKIAVREVGINAIEWGHRKEADKIINAIFRIEPNCMTVTIRDSGPGFDPRQIPHAAQPGDPVGHLDARQAMGLREGGFGIILARGLVDELRYNDRGNEACLIKYLTRTPAGAVG